MLPLSPHPSRTHLAAAALVPLATALLCFGAYVATGPGDPQPAGPVYSLSALWTGLQRDPGRWLGRMIRARAVAEPCASWITSSPAHCANPRGALFDAGPQANGALLLLPDRTAPTARAWLRRLPIVGSSLPTPPELRWGVPADYTLRVRLVSCPAAGISPCFEDAALLL